jgi:hypothetical protein
VHLKEDLVYRKPIASGGLDFGLTQ